METPAITFGPVPSRRLGRSLGINNIPPKVCSYSCVYCQIGATSRQETKPQTFFHTEDIVQQVKIRIEALRDRGEIIDYLTFVPDGEPTLDMHLGGSIDLLRAFGLKIAVISNGSLLWQPEVRKSLARADWVSVKVDAVDERSWQKINRPQKDLELDSILQGIQLFADMFEGELVTETMLLRGLNDTSGTVAAIAEFIATIAPDKAYVAIPTRPPAEDEVRPPFEKDIVMAYQIFYEKIPNAEIEYLIEYEGEKFVAAGNIQDELLSIASVHPLREEALGQLLKDANASHDVINKLIKEKKIKMTEYQGKRFYLRNIKES